MYIFKVDMVEKLLDGRKAKWLASEIGYNNCVISLILNGKKSVKKALAIAIVKTMNNDFEVEEFFNRV